MQIIGNQVIRLQDVDSTNNFAANLLNTTLPPEGTAILAYNQFGGKGQRGAVWQAEPGANLTLSVILYPKKIPASSQFILSKMVAVALADAVDEVSGLSSRIKWPNDILLNNKKVAGILIESAVSGMNLSQAIIGMGLNVNQQNFEGLPRASSLAVEAGKAFDKEQVMQQLFSLLNYYYMVLQRGNTAKIDELYLEKLFGYREDGLFRHSGGIDKGKITGIKENGRLEIEFSTGRVMEFENKEVEFLY
ncbi:MAG: biotin--[acetyl-CoA-carboxylase] ligase [Bacteroidota bacterium]